MNYHEKKKEIIKTVERLNKFYTGDFQLDIDKTGAKLTINNRSRDISPKLGVNDLYHYMEGFEDSLGLIMSNSIKEKN
jgi:hypothetical protein